MLDSVQSLLDSFPESVVQVRGGTVLASNEKARQYLPQLTPGAPLPACIALPEQGESGTGSFVVDDTVYSYSCKSGPEGCVLSFRPSPREAALKEWQLDGALQQLRALLGDILAEAGGDAFPGQGAPAGFNKTFHRLFRLISNLEFMQQAAGEEGVPFRPVTMDLAGLCRHVEALAAPLLKEAGVLLEYRSRESGLLIPGDPALLQKLLLGLIANGARASEGGDVVLSLRRQGARAVLTVSHSGSPADEPHLNALLRPGVGGELPLPGQGAGLGLSAARRIAALHGGSLLMEWGRSAPGAVVSLPTGPLDGKATVRTPELQRGGGLDPVLMELSDLLPARVFGLEGLD